VGFIDPRLDFWSFLIAVAQQVAAVPPHSAGSVTSGEVTPLNGCLEFMDRVLVAEFNKLKCTAPLPDYHQFFATQPFCFSLFSIFLLT